MVLHFLLKFENSLTFYCKEMKDEFRDHPQIKVSSKFRCASCPGNPNQFPIPGLYLLPLASSKKSLRISCEETLIKIFFSHALRNLQTSPNSIQKSPAIENLVAPSENLIKRICDNNFFLLLCLTQTCIGSGCVSLLARVRIKMRFTFFLY